MPAIASSPTEAMSALHSAGRTFGVASMSSPYLVLCSVAPSISPSGCLKPSLSIPSAATSTATLGTQVFGAVVAQHGLDLLKRLPTYVTGIFVLYHDPPVHSRTRRLDRPSSRKGRQLLARPTVNKSTSIGRILQHGGDGRNGWTPPAYLAIAIPARKREAACGKSPPHFGRGPGVQKALEEQCYAFLHHQVLGQRNLQSM